MTVRYRGYHRSDPPALVAAWNASMPLDPVTLDWFTEYVLLDEAFEPDGLVVATDDTGQVVGAVFAVPPPAGDAARVGWMPFLYVHPRARRNGVGNQLLDEALAFLQARGCTAVDVACYPAHYFLPGVDPAAYPDGHRLLLRNGFAARSSPVAMDRSLVGYAVPDEIAALRETREREGYVFAPPEPGDLPELTAFASRRLAPDWGGVVRDSVVRGLPLRRLLVARRGDTVVGFAMYGAYRGLPERFGPYGVDETARGTGIGAILLYDTLAAMRAEGLHTAWFLWTDEDSPAGRLYQRAGFAVTRRFDVLRRTL